MNKAFIDEYEKGGESLAQAVNGLSPSELLATPIAGKWSTQQVVVHLADAEAAFADRIRRIIAMDNPVLLAWDENRFTDRLYYNKQSVADALAIVSVTRRQVARILRTLQDTDFNRAGEHSEKGRQTLIDVINFATKHLQHHLKFIEEKRKILITGKTAGVE